MDVTEHKQKFITMAERSVKIETPVIFDSVNGTIQVGERHVIDATLSYNFSQFNESDEQAFNAFLNYLMLNIIDIAGGSGKFKFKLETPVGDQMPEATFSFTGVKLQLDLDIADDNIKQEVLDLIGQAFIMYQLPDKLPEELKCIVSFVLSQFPGTDVAVVVAKKETEQKPESEPEQGPELKTELESET